MNKFYSHPTKHYHETKTWLPEGKKNLKFKLLTPNLSLSLTLLIHSSHGQSYMNTYLENTQNGSSVFAGEAKPEDK